LTARRPNKRGTRCQRAFFEKFENGNFDFYRNSAALVCPAKIYFAEIRYSDLTVAEQLQGGAAP
jgi:methenyltetrahydromethanopterin cyclohydrolase